MVKSINILEPFVPLIAEMHSFINRRSNLLPQTGIAYINTHDQSGGASKVAFMLANYFRTQELNVSFWTHIKRLEEPWIYSIPKVHTEGRLYKRYEQAALQGGWLDVEKTAPVLLTRHPTFSKADIVHLHNIHGGFFSYAVLPHLAPKRKLIWTLHDDHIITGHCGFSMKCNRWENGCGSCPDLSVYPAVKKDRTEQLLRYKKKWIKKANPIFVTPSAWLAGRVVKAYPALAHNIKIIPNGINTDTFQKGNKEKERLKWGLNPNDKVLFYAAELSLNNPFKGGKVILDLLNKGLGEGWKLLTVGGQTQTISDEHISMGYINSEAEMNSLMNACDLMIYPTAADNHPLIVLEALASGLPVIASAVGGVPEIIIPEKNGMLVHDYESASAFKTAIDHFFDLPIDKREEMSDFATLDAKKRFSSQLMFHAYQNLYKEVRSYNE